jgi:GTP pyrophosphokinase
MGNQPGLSTAASALGAERRLPTADRNLRPLMEGFFGRLPENQRVGPVRLSWQEFWGKASRYLDRGDLQRIGEALVFAAEAHGEQKRHSGEPYIVHTIGVASNLADMELDRETLEAALLHDVLEDTPVTSEAMKARFGQGVLTLVDGVTKLGKLPFKSIEDYQAENLRKMFLVMAKDIRVVLIKLADRLHNMRTLSAHRRDRQLSIAKETLEIYAPLAHRLGIYQIKRELEDLAFKVMDPEMYYEIRRRVRKKLPEREAIIKQAIDGLTQRLQEDGVDAYINGRPKHFFSIYEKMKRKNLSLDQLYDLLALRVIVNSLSDCYQVLGIVHTVWKPIPGQFDDYIANPKSNMYQSLHTTVVGPSGEPLEVQIRTWEMHWLAEYGIAAHWHYKEGGKRVDGMDQKLTWIRQALESHSEGSPSEFMDHLKTDVLSNEVFVFTPKGDVFSLPTGSTPIDFAYAVHTEVGHRCVGSMVGGRIVPMDYKLQNGDIVRVLTSPQGKPSRDWLKIAKSSRTRNKIRSWFKQQDRAEREERLAKGRELLERDLARRAPDQTMESLSPQISRVARDIGYANTEELLVAVATGNQTPSGVWGRIFEHGRPSSVPAEDSPPPLAVATPRKEIDAEIVVEGAEGVQVSLAQCCRPIPGDPIVGFVTKVRGITIHRQDCPNLEATDPGRRISVAWGRLKQARYTARLKLEGMDRPGLISDVTQAIAAVEGTLSGIRANLVGGTRNRMIIEVQVRDLEHLYRILARLNAIDGVIAIARG